MDLDTMTLEELEGYQQDLNAQRAALKADAQAVQQVIDQKSAAVEIVRKLATMSDAEKALLVQMIQSPNGIASGTVVGTPGK